MLKIKKGQRFGKLTIIGEGVSGTNPNGKKFRTILCICDCGEKKTIRLGHLWNGKTISCGCKRGENHGEVGSGLYARWSSIKYRCQPAVKGEKYYFKKGIFVCKEWEKYTNFKKWAMNNGYSPELTIDRIDNNKGYFPENCRFVSMKINVRNRDVTTIVVYNGERVVLADLLEQKNILHRFKDVYQRLFKYGWDAEKSVNMPFGGAKTQKRRNGRFVSKIL